ncbi:DUF4112 domain-containing protein [Arhodomonas aquaeolei]|uniref:DUF4112 domain-containing protein n=1 Tax=Arhodomonas aquaeolei TaxID=2369 RepID=UPI002168198A|nr:DUF4112 domain-containing protein [Arhodomonas aquaeolei]MCS4504804.1 DUF4112 domain-containing protein [Arhodomonas aquaeolei]
MSIDARPRDEAAALRRLERFAVFMDTALPVPGTSWRIGADALVGLLPGIGDGVMAVLALYPVLEARRLGVRRRTLARMLANIAVDFAVGSIPLAGDVFDAGFRANRRNVDLLRRTLAARRRE